MEQRDLIVTPIVLLLIYFGAYLVRPYVTDSLTRRYFFPALTLRIVGAIALGFIYQYYYSGGDTFNYHTRGSRIVWEAFMDDPLTGIRIIFGSIQDESGIYEYSGRILFFHDPSSFFVIRISSFFDLLTFSTYSATAVLFAVTSFVGSWMFFKTFYNHYPHLHLSLAIASFFVPSIFFWGSGILKDTIVLSAVGFATYCIDKLFIGRKIKFITILYLLISLYVIFEVRKFILQAFIPAALLWVYFKYLKSVRSVVVRTMIFPVLIGIIFYLMYSAVVKIGEGDRRYSVSKLAQTAKITAYDIGFFTGRDAGSRYSLGELDGTFGNMLEKAPAAINVTLFRPYLWEVKNPLMFFSALESLCITLFFAFVILKRRGKLLTLFRNPDIIFLMTVTLVLAFAVGITSYNFGTLSRYKILLFPFFLSALGIINSSDHIQDNFDEHEGTGIHSETESSIKSY